MRASPAITTRTNPAAGVSADRVQVHEKGYCNALFTKLVEPVQA
jgi:hypothetical protein